MKLFKTIVFACVFGSFILWGFTSHTQQTKVVKGAGCKTEFFLLKDLTEAYKSKTGNKLLIGSTGNKDAVNLMLEGKIDFTFTCKPIKKLTKGLKLNPNDVASWKSIAIAKDPIVIVSNPVNGVQNLTKEQLTQLFQGKFGNWKELGGNDIPIELAYLAQDMESGVVLLFKEFTVSNKGNLTENAMIADGPSKLGHYVSATPGGVTFMAYNSYKRKFGQILQINGITPTRESILNGAHGLAATYYLTLDGRMNSVVADFVKFSTSSEGKEAIEKNFIPVLP